MYFTLHFPLHFTLYSLTEPLGWNKSLMFLKSDFTIVGSDRPPALAA